MLNTFPSFLTYMLVAPFILRVVLGYFFINFAYTKLVKDRSSKIRFFEKAGMKPGKVYVWVVGIIEALAGIALIIGMYTQIASIIVGIILLAAIFIKYKKPELLEGESAFFITLLAIALSLLFSGAGFWAVDVGL